MERCTSVELLPLQRYACPLAMGRAREWRLLPQLHRPSWRCEIASAPRRRVAITRSPTVNALLPRGVYVWRCLRAEFRHRRRHPPLLHDCGRNLEAGLTCLRL
ncbi:hypothetical protein MTO96_000108 [Rhipicephalus appendiculatus]